MVWFFLILNLIIIGFVLYVVINSSRFGNTIYKSTQKKGWAIFWIILSLANLILLIMDFYMKVVDYEFLNRNFWIIYGIYFSFFINRNVIIKEKGIIVYSYFIKWENIDKFYFDDKGLKIEVKGKLREFDYIFIDEEKEQILQYVKQYTKKDTLS